MKKGLLLLTFALMTLAPTGASAAIWYGPYWGPAYYGGYYPYAGQVKLDTKVRDAEVFINGAFAGTTHQNKTMHLRPGDYNIEIREAGVSKFTERVLASPARRCICTPRCDSTSTRALDGIPARRGLFTLAYSGVVTGTDLPSGERVNFLNQLIM